MKKARILFISALIALFACILLMGCSKTDKISSIDLKESTPDAVIETQIGKFDFDAYTLVVSYDSGSTSEVRLKESMISELDRLKLYQAGDHVLTVSYGGKTCELKISVKRNTFGDLKFPENNVFTYDGKEHKVELIGELPANATVSYLGGNSFVNAGTYDVTAVVSCNGYVTERITTKVTVERASYDMSNVKFEPVEVVYDGKAHTVEISGQLPEGVDAPTYYINGNKTASAVDVDEYTVTAVFANNNPNYEAIPNMETTLKITPVEYAIGDIDLVFKNEDGEELIGPWKIYDGLSVTFDVSNRNALSNHIKFSYTITNADGELISGSNTQTNIKNAGVYTIEVAFDLLDNKNYKEIEPVIFTFEILKAKYDTSKLFFDSMVVDYDMEKHSIAATLPPNLDASKINVEYEYRLGGNLIFDGDKNADGVVAAGEYSVKAIFAVKDPNYEEIAPMEATLLIRKKELPVQSLSFDSADLIYTGNAMMPSLRVENEGYFKFSEVSVYKLEGDAYVKVDSSIDAGTYRAELTVSVSDTRNYVFDNGEIYTTVVGDFVILEANKDISDIGFSDSNPEIIDRGDGALFVFDTANIDDLKFEAAFHKIDGANLEVVFEKQTLTPNDLGMLEIPFDGFGLDVGRYILTVTVTSEDSNYVLQDGSATAEFYYEFEIAD